MKRKTLVLVIGITPITIMIILGIISLYLYGQSDDTLFAIQYICTTGLKPNPGSGLRTETNGTHTIDINTCKWMENEEYRRYLDERLP